MSDTDEKRFLQDYKDNLRLAIEQLKDESVQRSAADGTFDGAVFWNRINSTVKVVSSACTKLCLAYNSAPFPSTKESQPLLEGVLNGVLALLSAFYALPKSQGLHLQKQMRKSVIEIVEAVLHLVEAISLDVLSLKQQLHSTGSVWEQCDAFADLPKDSREWILLEINRTSCLVKDALHELDEAIHNETTDMFDDFAEVGLGGGEGETVEELPSMPAWTEQNKAILAPCQGLVKVCRACLKRLTVAVKARGKCDSAESVAQLDDIGQCCAGLSALVDDVVSCLYPPLAHTTLGHHVDRLSLHLHSLLDYSRQSHVTCEEDASWLDFLLKAIDHNVLKVQQLTK